MRSINLSLRFLSLAIVSACGSNSTGTPTDTNLGIDAPSVDASNPVTNVAITLTNHPINPATFGFLVAFQDGPTGTWKLAPAPAGDVYTLPITSGKYAFAWTCTAAAIREVELAYFTVAEHASLATTIPGRCTDVNTTVKLTGTVSKLAAGRTIVSFGTVSADAAPGTGAYSLDVEPGTHDLVVAHTAAATGAGTTDVTVDKAVVVRNLAVTAATAQNVDFSTAVATQSFPVTIALGNGERGTAITTLFTADGTSPDLVRNTVAPFASIALAAAQGVATDVYNQSITVSAAGQTGIVSNATTTPAAQTYTAPQPFGGATAAVVPATTYPEVATMWSAYPNAVGYGWSATQALTIAQCGTGATVACSVDWGVELSAGSVAATPEFTMPDLSALAGWNTQLQFVTGTMVSGTAEGLTSTGGAADFPPGTPAAGTERTTARSSWTVTP